MQLTWSLMRTTTHTEAQTSTLQAKNRLQPSSDICKPTTMEPRSRCGTHNLDLGDLTELAQFLALNAEVIQ
jgi:hypothetical protein